MEEIQETKKELRDTSLAALAGLPKADLTAKTAAIEERLFEFANFLEAKIVILVDDGIATGETMKSAVIWLTSRDQPQRPNAVVVAVPVCSVHAATELQKLADRLVCLAVPENFWAVGQFYWDFDQVSDDEVMEYLEDTTADRRPPTAE